MCPRFKAASRTIELRQIRVDICLAPFTCVGVTKKAVSHEAAAWWKTVLWDSPHPARRAPEVDGRVPWALEGACPMGEDHISV